MRSAERTCTRTGETCDVALPLQLKGDQMMWSIDGLRPTRAPYLMHQAEAVGGGECAGLQAGSILEALLCYSAADALQNFRAK